MATSSDETLCPDWVFLNNCNVHVAKDRGWFKTYTPFTSTIDASPYIASDNRYLPVLGIGTVEIPTKRSPNLSGVAAHGTLLLREVLHVPGSICNFIGNPLFREGDHEVSVSRSSKSNGTIKNSEGKNIAYFDPKSPLFAIKVRHEPKGPKLGSPALKQGVLYMLACHWEPAQRQKWEEFKMKNGLFSKADALAGIMRSEPPYSREEKEYPKKHYDSEYQFLLEFGLDINDEDDRTDGRMILRGLMRGDASDDEFGEEFDEGSEDDEFDLEGHQADYNFSSQQLDWIEQHYGNSEAFMLSYGLKFYDDDDVEEAKSIATAMMANDEYVAV